MCGIFAYNGNKNSIPFLVEGLTNLEYRGYDSAGVFGITGDGKVFLEKAVGKVSNLAGKVELNNEKDDNYKSGIAHTRWATHGGVTEENTHPHYSNNERFFVVHNGIIENYASLKDDLIKKGYKFYSETDTEIVAKLIEDEFEKDLITTISKITKKLVGAYALAIINKENPDSLIGTKFGSPMILGIGEDSCFLSSDINALSQYCFEFFTLEDDEIVVVNNGKHKIFNFGKEVDRKAEEMTQEFATATKGEFETFTEKEINEAPDVLLNSLKGRINFEEKTITSETLKELNELDIERIEIIASGSSYFAGVTSSYWFKELSGMPCEVRISSEFLYDTFIPNSKTLYIFISQSGETADVRESVKIVKEKGGMTFGIVNVVGSTVAKMCDFGLYTHSGVEVGVASTKNIIGQLGVLLLMALNFGTKRNLQIKEVRKIIVEIEDLSKLMQAQLNDINHIKKIAKKYSQYKNFFFLGRNLLYGTAEESAFKIKGINLSTCGMLFNLRIKTLTISFSLTRFSMCSYKFKMSYGN
ncbi:MAG: glutamine--fructose-6-phosphate transaminase (isomerizing) [Candidatus Gracilibacteria bacterium]|nr:glutamine--fructose-6-phosphate transaminase (isomerizing) [Candidatus Gracilibacteria bacterium]